ncbi:MAG: 3'-5' exonuclease [Deltaproteobacteria bacterium]|nr:3'-5' exonuclease [Deltaproteobacteria bacterium]
MRELKLDRPLVFFDLETTGLDTDKDRIVELCTVTLLPDGSRSVWTQRVHPGIPIPADATAVHGIADADVADCPRFAELAEGLHTRLQGCDLAGYNIERFDLKLLKQEFSRCGKPFPVAGTRIVDVYGVYASRERRDLTAALRFYCGRELQGAHSAEADVLATVDVLMAQVQRYADLPDTVQALHDEQHPHNPDALDPDGKLLWQDGAPTFTFGKIKGWTLQKVVRTDPGYLRWMLSGSFSDELKRIVADALDGRFPVRREAPTPGRDP